MNKSPGDMVVGDLILDRLGRRFRIERFAYMGFRASAVHGGEVLTGSVRDLTWDGSRKAWLIRNDPARADAERGGPLDHPQ